MKCEFSTHKKKNRKFNSLCKFGRNSTTFFFSSQLQAKMSDIVYKDDDDDDNKPFSLKLNGKYYLGRLYVKVE